MSRTSLSKGEDVDGEMMEWNKQGQIEVKRVLSSVADPDPFNFRPPGSDSGNGPGRGSG